MNGSSTQCISNAYGKEYLTNDQVLLLVITDSLILIGNFTANLLVLFLLVNTNQLKSYSCKFIFLLSIADVLSAFTVQTFYMPVNVLQIKPSCTVVSISQFLSATFPRLSAYTVGLMGLDRYIRIKYRITLNSIITPVRAYILMTTTTVLTLIVGIMTVTGINMNKTQLVRGITTFIDSIVFICIVALQIKTISILKANVESAHNPDVLRATSDKMIQLASRIMKMFIILILPFLVISSLHTRYARKLRGSSRCYMEFAFRLSFIGSYLNSLGNAVLFLTTNTPAKHYLKRNIICLRSNQITSENPMSSDKT